MALNHSHVVSTSSLPVPTITEDNIEAYFYSLDFWFSAYSITNDNKILASVPSNKLIELCSIIDAAPTSFKFKHIQDMIIVHFSNNQ